MTARRSTARIDPTEPTGSAGDRPAHDAPGGDGRDPAGAAGASPWRPPTRRAFVAALGAAAAALAIRERGPGPIARVDDDDRPRSTWAGRTRWIGHC